MKSKILIFLSVIMLISLFPITASADMGPKPSLIVEFENMGDEPCYGTLLSEDEYFGPYSVWDGDEEHIYNYDLDLDIWRKFAEYKDVDGFVFLQTGWNLKDEPRISWTYYPPAVFKILLYYPETDTFIVSDVYERYAFDSYFTVNMESIDPSAIEGEQITAYRSYDYGREVGSLILRIILTVVIEMLVALIFGFVEKRQLVFLASVNIVTQIILNILLNVINYNSGEFALIFYYVIFELAIFAIEAIAYSIFLKKLSIKQHPSWVYVTYALIANALSFILGMYMLSFMIPSIF